MTFNTRIKYDFWCDDVKQKYGEKVKLCFMNTLYT